MKHKLKWDATGVVMALVQAVAIVIALQAVLVHAAQVVKVVVMADAITLVMAHAQVVAQDLLMLNTLSSLFSLFRDHKKSIKSDTLLCIDAWGNNNLYLRNITSGNIIIKKVIAPSSITLVTVVRDFMIEPEGQIAIKYTQVKEVSDNFQLLLMVNDIKRNHYILVDLYNNTPKIDVNYFHILKFRIKNG